MNLGAMKKNEIKSRAFERPFIEPAADALTPVESEDLSRLEGEGGQEAPITELAGSHLLPHRAPCGKLNNKAPAA
jgi:hypothetical protein